MRTNIPSKSEGPIPEHCQVIKLFSINDPGDLCPQDHLLVRTSHDLDLWLKGHILFSSILPISLIVLGTITANGILLYAKQVTPPPNPLPSPPSGWGGDIVWRNCLQMDGGTTDNMWSQKLTLSLCDRCAKNRLVNSVDPKTVGY